MINHDAQLCCLAIFSCRLLHGINLPIGRLHAERYCECTCRPLFQCYPGSNGHKVGRMLLLEINVGKTGRFSSFQANLFPDADGRKLRTQSQPNWQGAFRRYGLPAIACETPTMGLTACFRVTNTTGDLNWISSSFSPGMSTCLTSNRYCLNMLAVLPSSSPLRKLLPAYPDHRKPARDEAKPLIRWKQ